MMFAHTQSNTSALQTLEGKIEFGVYLHPMVSSLRNTDNIQIEMVDVIKINIQFNNSGKT